MQNIGVRISVKNYIGLALQWETMHINVIGGTWHQQTNGGPTRGGQDLHQFRRVCFDMHRYNDRALRARPRVIERVAKLN